MSTTTAKKTQTTKLVRVALYLRISADPNNNAAAVKRQEKESRAFISKQDGWKLVTVYIDNDTTANTDYGKRRPEYERMMQDAREGRLDAIVAWSLDRLTRSPRECEDVLDLHDRHKVELATLGGVVDLATPFGRAAVRVYITFARLELEQRRYRQLSERREWAEAGKVHKGGKRPYGYYEDRITINEAEAEVIREATERVLSGQSLRGICGDFAKRKVPGPNGNPLTPRGLRQILRTARISGRREHWQGAPGEKRPAVAEIVGDAEWEGIITVDESDQLRELFADEHRIARPMGNVRKHLLPGFLHCSECKQPMQSASVNGGKGYACRYAPGQKCKRTVMAHLADDVVVAKLLTLIEDPKTHQLLQKRTGVDKRVVKQLRVDQADMDQLAEDEANKLITRSEWLRKRAVIAARIAEGEAHIQSRLNSEALAKLMTGEGTIEQRWELLTLEQRRSVMALLIKRIELKPPVKLGRNFDPHRVHVEWVA